ncbi:MAG: response regulator transcription factor [Candidatus Eremiobacteraeota bacterium]|nr:response regulator transcription factor [Candidatus Eremiobacteraeota bacterium]
MSYRILIAEDERKIADFVFRYLKKEGYLVDIKYRGDDALAMILTDPPDLVILDIMLPGMDGLEVLRRMREKIYLPVILLTSKSDETDRVVGLEMGADDYVTKPFSPRELVARVKAIFRRMEALKGVSGSADIIKSHNIKLDLKTRALESGKRSTTLTSIEFSLLKLLMKHPGRVYSRDELLDLIWGEEFIGETRTVDVHIKNLRKKIKGLGGSPDIIRSVWGVGYTFED